MNEDVRRIVSLVAEVAGWLWQRGWAEAGAGNISVDLPGGTTRKILVTATGSRMRDIAREPESGLGIIKLTDGGPQIIWPERVRFCPTSDLAVHLEIHRMRPGLSVLHTHPTELIALARLLPDETELNSALFGAHIEIPILLPRGVGLVSAGVLSIATGNALRNRDLVLWPGHGAIAVADDLHKAFDLIDVANKAARIYLLARGE